MSYMQRQSNTRMEEQKARKIPNKGQKSTKQETLVASSTAKDLVEIGANMANQQVDQDMLAMLKQINEQLKQIKSQSNDNQQKQEESSNKQTQGENSGTEQLASQSQPDKGKSAFAGQGNEQNKKTEIRVSEELSKLFSQLLKNQDSQQSQSQSQSNDNEKQSEEESGSSKKAKNGAIAVQTAAQVLAEAQYELANELDASLKKLKQVISESEKIANKISNLLGEGNATNK